MLAKILSGTTIGLDSIPVEIEVDIASGGLPSFTIVGLPDKAVEEAKERVRSAIKNIGADFPSKRITINMAPADLPKEGTNFDLPIALGLLMASGQLINKFDPSDSLWFGELSLNGDLRSVPGTLLLSTLARDMKLRKLFLPKGNAKEASVITGLELYPLESLRQLIDHINEIIPIKPVIETEVTEFLVSDENYDFDFSDVKGQENAKRALEIAAAGGHNLILKGPPGGGKTLLAKAFPSILPELTINEALEATKIYSVNGLLPTDKPLINKRPFRSPHHTASYVGLVGGGTHPKPGEISLAHRGVLFLDEFGEFPRQVLESLRQPLEDGYITVSRAEGTIKFPAKFILIAATNPCPCGFLGDNTRECICTSSQVSRYKKRISGPILDRIDLHIDVPAVKVEKLTDDEVVSESSKDIKKRVQKSRDIQTKRLKDRGITCNAEMTPKEIKEFCPLDVNCLALLRQAVSKMGLSARSYHRVIKVARTIADLSGRKAIASSDIAEALQYRSKE